MIINIVAWLTRGRVVYLRDMEGDIYKSIAYTDAFGFLSCRVFPLCGVGRVFLLAHGKADGSQSRCSFIKEWKYANAPIGDDRSWGGAK